MAHRSDPILDYLRRNLSTFSYLQLGLLLGPLHSSTPSKMGIQCSWMVRRLLCCLPLVINVYGVSGGDKFE